MMGHSFDRAPRSLARELRLPSVLLTLALAGLCANVSGPLAAEPAPSPAPVTASSEATRQLPLPASVYQRAEPAAPTAQELAAETDAADAAGATGAMTLPAAFAKGVKGLSPKVLRAAFNAVSGAHDRGVAGRKDLLTVIDYSLPSTQPRLWVLDLKRGKVLFKELVAHGAGSGDLYATQFSNVNDSRQTSLGLFLTEDTYEGGNGYSLRLRGLDAGVNDLAEKRNIVMHGAWYVSNDHISQFGRIGRSWGCPALSPEEAKPVIDTIKGGSFIFSYAPSGRATGLRAPVLRAAATTPRHGGATIARRRALRAKS